MWLLCQPKSLWSWLWDFGLWDFELGLDNKLSWDIDQSDRYPKVIAFMHKVSNITFNMFQEDIKIMQIRKIKLLFLEDLMMQGATLLNCLDWSGDEASPKHCNSADSKFASWSGSKHGHHKPASDLQSWRQDQVSTKGTGQSTQRCTTETGALLRQNLQGINVISKWSATSKFSWWKVHNPL